MRRLIDPDLRTLQDLLARMYDLVDDQLASAVNALVQQDAALATQVRRRDDEVDEFELAVDHEAVRVLALHQPVADDLRFIIAAVKLNTDLERIGDQSKNLAKYTPHISSRAALGCAPLLEMTDAARAMLRKSQDAFQQRDHILARRILAQDAEVDDLHDRSVQELLTFGRAHPEELESVAYLLRATKAIERIADHAKNIAQSVVFLVEGIDIRHTRKTPRADKPSNA